mgnify:CR=1 FL=1
MSGQINRGSKLGELIFNFASNTDYKVYVEIGTWNGQGSTLCFRQGLETRDDDWSFFSFESDENFYRQAESFHGKIDAKFNLIYGRIIEPEDMMSLDSPVVKEHYENHVHESIHTRFFNHDYGAYGKCTNKLHLLEDLEIDVLLLDGGEFSTYAEFEILKDRAKIIILDDTTELKTKHVHAALISDSDWDCLLESSERHGYSMHRRIA